MKTFISNFRRELSTLLRTFITEIPFTHKEYLSFMTRYSLACQTVETNIMSSFVEFEVDAKFYHFKSGSLSWCIAWCMLYIAVHAIWYYIMVQIVGTAPWDFTTSTHILVFFK